MIPLATNQTTDGASAASHDHAGGIATFQVLASSVFDGAEIISAEYSPDDGVNWYFTGVAITAHEAFEGKNIELDSPCKIRSFITGSGAGENTNISTALIG